MGLLDAYQDKTDTAISVMSARPFDPEPVKPKHSAWSAIPRAVAAGAAEVVGNVMDTAGAFGQVAAAAGGITPGFDPDQQKNRQASTEAMATLKTDGIKWRTDEAQQAYKFGADLRPDPLTAGTAENIVFGLTKGLTKAVGSAVALGPVGGAASFGVSEGMTTAEDLAVQGVDQTTRTQVGAVVGGMSALGVALPVAGKTLAQTAGLVVAGGPASFIAQQMATREILRGADYKALAEQYDPLDPVGLAVATLLPAGFAAYAKRGGFASKAAPKADGQPVADTAPAMQGDSIPATPEAIDAAMVQNLTSIRDMHADLAPDGAGKMISDIPETPTVKDSLIDQTGEIPPVETNQGVTQDAYRAKVDALATEQPDLIARLDDAGQPVKLSDELAAIRKEAQEGTDTDFGALDAPLLQVAAECALSIGTAGL